MKVSPIQQSFNGGELSPLLLSRTDVRWYATGQRYLSNQVPLVQGGVTRRPGTYHVAEVKDSSKKVRLVEFQFSVEQAYILEFGDQYIRFYMDHGQIVSGGTPYEIAAPYLEADLFELKWAQSADVLFLTHPDYAPRKLSRTGHTAWTLSIIDFFDGPYLPTSATSTQFTVAAETGSGVTLTASATDGINDGLGFVATDVGRAIRMRGRYTDTADLDEDGDVAETITAWGWAKIASVVSPTIITVDIQDRVSTNIKPGDWQLGLWSDTTGYPSCVTFFEDRLFFGGTKYYPQRIDGSRTGDYENFTPTDWDGLVVDDHAVSYTLSADNVNVIRWISDDEKGLLVGTVGGEWVVRPSVLSESLSPLNVKASRSTTYGSADVMPVKAGSATLYIQRAGRKLREMAYSFENDGYRSPELSILAEHITRGGITEIDYQHQDISVIWAVRSDGVLLGVTYDREQDVVGWHRHIVGGVSDANGTAAKVESIAVIPSPDDDRDELWLLVQRHVNGQTKRYVEYMADFWEEGMDQADAFFVDSGLTYSGAPADTISGLDHLEGETVSVLADGAVHPDVTVSAGAITLGYEASKVHVGLGYVSDGQSLPIDANVPSGSGQGKTKRIHRLAMRLHETLGLKVGTRADALTEVTFRKTSDPLDSPPPLFSGVLEVPFEAGYSTEATVYWRQSQPLPLTILALLPEMRVYDR